MCAAMNGCLEVVTFLVDAGASMDIADNVSSRIRLCVQTKYNPHVHCYKTITTSKYDVLICIYILYLFLFI